MLIAFSERGGGEETERNIDQLPTARAPTRTKPAAQACALTGNQTRDLSVYKTMPNQLSHTSQGRREIYFKEWAPASVRLASPKSGRLGQQGDPRRSCSLSLKVVCWQGSFFFWGGWSFSIKAFNWSDEAHPHLEGIRSVFLKVNLFKC